DGERTATVVAQEILHVLEQEHPRALRADDRLDVEKQRSVGRMLEAMLVAERVALRDPGDGEGLTRDTRSEYVVVRNVLVGDRRDVAVWLFTPVRIVGDLRVPIPLARLHALGAEG